MRHTALGLTAVLAVAALAGCGPAREEKDPLAAEIERWSAAPGKPLAGAEDALRDGRRLLALQRVADARTNLAAAAYVRQRPASQRRDMAGFEAEWARMGSVLRDGLGRPSAAALERFRPAAVRALAEAAIPQVRAYYDASLEYGRSTVPDSGLFYLGSAQAQSDLVAWLRELDEESSGEAPPLRSLGPELDALEGEVLAAYRPPASIDRHGEFITAGALLKEARELDAAGLRYGALLRYLEASLRSAMISGPPAPGPEPGPEALAARLREHERRLAAEDVDHSLGRMFLEAAQSNQENAAPGKSPRKNPVLAVAVAEVVLPRYFAALGPERPLPSRIEPQVTVTLVRWPYT